MKLEVLRIGLVVGLVVGLLVGVLFGWNMHQTDTTVQPRVVEKFVYVPMPIHEVVYLNNYTCSIPTKEGNTTIYWQEVSDDGDTLDEPNNPPYHPTATPTTTPTTPTPIPEFPFLGGDR
jgi:hypothetical protein